METTHVALAVGVVLILYLVVYRRSNRLHKPGYGAPTKARLLDPFFGLDGLLKTTYDVRAWTHYHDAYGTTYAQVPLYSTPMISTADADNVYEIMTGKSWGVEWRKEGMQQLAGIGLITSDGEEWAHVRKMFRPSFKKENIVDLSFLGEQIDELIRNVSLEEGKKIDMQPLLTHAFMDSSLNFIFGIDTRHPDTDAPLTIAAFLKLWEKALIGMGLRIALGGAAMFLPKAGYVKTCTQIHEFVDFYMRKNSTNKEGTLTASGNQTVARSLISQCDDKGIVRNNLAQAILGSQDTTSTLAAHTLELLAQHPKLWVELREEVQKRGDELLNFDALRTNTFIQNILKESLRLRPVFPAMGRIALRDTTLPTNNHPTSPSPIFIPKGTIGVANFYVMNRSPTVFGPSPESFNPHRWETIKPEPKEFTVFGIGPRSCLGKEKALVEAAYVLARLAKEFQVLEWRGEGFRGESKMTMSNALGCKVAFQKGSGSAL